ncbi:MAG TPA: CSLREA domain-containing protein, partial [Terriglobales bacterium]|nr:CSLREA domain-containing protein [Terriglobales bacterium]
MTIGRRPTIEPHAHWGESFIFQHFAATAAVPPHIAGTMVLIRWIILMLACCCGPIAVAGQTPTPTPQLCCVVDSTGDGADDNPGDGLCDDGGGACTLRSAIDEANTDPGTIIAFDIPSSDSGCDSGSGVCTVEPQTEFPLVFAANTVIDGTTQPGASCGDLWGGTPPTLKVRILGNGSLYRALGISGAGVEIRGLWIVGFDGEDVEAVDSNNSGLVVQCNQFDANSIGVWVGGANSEIGGLAAGEGNVFEGPSLVRFSTAIKFGEVVGGSVAGNFIGTNPLGASARPFFHGIAAYSSDEISIASNLISGNRTGIALSGWSNHFASNTTIVGNFIGTDRTGASPLGNEYGIHASRHTDTVIGGIGTARNVISANDIYGVVIGDHFNGYSGPATIAGNYIGTDSDGDDASGMCNGIAPIRDSGLSTSIEANTFGACSAPLGCCAFDGDNPIPATCVDSVAIGTAWSPTAIASLEPILGEPLWCNPDATCTTEGAFLSDCPPPGCRYIAVDADREAMTIAGGTEPFPSFGTCTDTILGDTLF